LARKVKSGGDEMAGGAAQVQADETVGPVARAFRMVRAIADAPRPVSLTELAEAVELAPSTAHRMLQLLARIQIVGRAGERQHYAPGPELRRIAIAVARNADVSERVREHVQALVAVLNTTAVYWNYDTGARMLVAGEIQYSTHLIDFREGAFAPRPLLWGAQGRAVLAFLDEAELRAHLAVAGAASPTGRRIEDVDALQAELAEIRERGFARSQGHTIADAVGFAAPVFGGDGRVVGCIGIPMPLSRFREEDAPLLSRAVVDTAAAISAEFGASVSTHRK